MNRDFSGAIRSGVTSCSCRLYRVDHSDVSSFVGVRSFYNVGMAVPCGRAMVPCLSRVDSRTGEVNTIGAILGGGNGLLNFGASFCNLSTLVGGGLVRVGSGAILVLKDNNASGATGTIVRDVGTGRVFIISQDNNGKFVACRTTRGVGTRIVVGAAPINVCPGGFSTPMGLNGFGGLRTMVSMVCGPLGARLVVSTRGHNVGTINNLCVLFCRTMGTTRVFAGGRVIASTFSRVLGRGRGLILVNVPSYKGAALNGVLTGRLRGRFVSASSRVIGYTSVPVDRVFRGCNRTCFESLRDGIVGRVSAGRGLIITANNNTILESGGMSTLGRGKDLIFVSEPLSVLVAARSEPLSDGIRLLGGECGRECSVCSSMYSIGVGTSSSVRAGTREVGRKVLGRGFNDWQPRCRCTQCSQTKGLQWKGVWGPLQGGQGLYGKGKCESVSFSIGL